MYFIARCNMLDGELVSSSGEHYVLDVELQYTGWQASKQWWLVICA